MSSQLVWVITGTSTGFGREIALEALARGDKVIATARGKSFQKLDDLKAKGADTLELDVTAPLGTLKEVAQKAAEIHGRIDVVVNNAGYGQIGMLEETTEEETFAQFNTNLFGGLNVARAFLPHMRPRRTGTLVWVGSLAGWTAVPIGGLYSGAKAAMRRFSDTFGEELKPLGIRSICIDPGEFRTAFLNEGHATAYTARIPDYGEMAKQITDRLTVLNNNQPGDPIKAVQIIVDVVRGEGVAKDKPFPKSLQLGSDCYQVAKASAEESLKTLEIWKDVSCSTDRKD